MNKKRFLITGAAGFLGSHLAQKLAEKNQVIALDVVDNLPPDIKQSVKFYKTDIAQSGIVEKIFRKERPQVVYHLAGPIALRREIDDSLFKKGLNILGDLDWILNCCVKYKVEKLIFFSSGGAIYEKTKDIPTPETYLAHPTSLYGLANLLIERYLRSFFQKYGLKFTILRFSNVYGQRQWESGIIPSIIIKLLKGEAPIIHGKGNQTRDFIFVEDAIRASIISMRDDRNSTYNISSGEEISINKLLNKIAIILDKSVKPIYVPSRINEIERSCLDISKIRKELGWQPKINIDQGLRKTIDWLKSNYVR